MRRIPVAIALLALPAVAAAQSDSTPARIVAVGDVHGDFERFVRVLRDAGVIDRKNRWSGGRTRLVQTGDILDRGPHSRRIMDLLMELEEQAKEAGGRVHALTGNHEAMNVLGDLRYVSAAEYEAFRSPQAERLRDRAYEALADPARKDDAAYREQWEADRPLGWVEHRLAFEAGGRYGNWIRGNDAVLKLGRYLFVHGGIGPAYADVPIDTMNARVRQDLEAADTVRGIADDPEGPLWYRGLAQGDEALLDAHVDHVLERFDVDHLVIGHTVTGGTVLTRHGGKVIMIDVGLSEVYGGTPACLIIENGVPRTLHRGTELELPLDGDPLPYLKAAAALDPAPSRLRKLIDALEGAAAPPA
jgi:hypothetical protein